MPLARVLVLVVLCLCLPWAAHAAQIQLPLRISLETLREAIAVGLAGPAGKGEVYRSGRCRHLTLEAPQAEAHQGYLRLVVPGTGAFGASVLGECRNLAAWRGTMRFTLAPYIDDGGRLRVRIAHSELEDADGRASPVFIWDMAKHHVHPRLERFAYDLGGLRTSLIELLATVAPPEQTAPMRAALAGLQLLQPHVEASHVLVPLSLGVPDAWLAAAPQPPAAPTAALTEAEIEALEKALAPWDAFLVFAVRQLALDNPDPELRRRLFTLLLDNRYQLVALLSGDAPVAGDPVRTLFLDAWSELRNLLGAARRPGLAPSTLLGYAAFVDAGDALLALEQAAPGLHLHLTADGLRRLARSLRPALADDPLAYGWDMDREMRELFGVEEPAVPSPSPSLSPTPSPPPQPRSLLDFFFRAAYAARPLDRWVPGADEIDDYAAALGELLAKTATGELARATLAAPHDRTYGFLVPTTALIESCWRQYAVRGGKLTYVRSQAGSVGLMQVNQHVWRGFYDVERLRWDTAYNARAGAQILLRYMRDYAIPYAARSGDPTHVPRAAYAVYNAGPRAVGRFNKEKRHPREARVDDRLWKLYQGIASGGRPDLRTCAVGNGG